MKVGNVTRGSNQDANSYDPEVAVADHPNALHFHNLSSTLESEPALRRLFGNFEENQDPMD